MNAFRVTLLSLVFAVGTTVDAESATRYFGDGLKIEATLETGENQSQLTITQYDSDWNEQQWLYGDLTAEGQGTFRLEYKWADGDDKEYTRTAKVSVAGGKLSYSELKESGGRKLDMPLSGGPWKEITAAMVLRNAKARFEAADKLLNAAWKQARTEMDEAGFAEMQESQRSWLDYRDDIAGRIALQAAELARGEEKEDKEGDKEPDYESLPAYWRQRTSQTADRTPVIRAWSGKSVPAGRGGIYRDSYGGEMTLEEKEDGLHFDINVVRTIGFNVGEVGGTAKLTGDTATWTDAPKPQGDKAAVLRFKFNANRSVTVESENADTYHGHNARFDGTYYKIHPLKAPAAAPK